MSGSSMSDRSPERITQHSVLGAPEARTLFGLPSKVEFCSRCVISNQRPSSVVEHLSNPTHAKPTIEFIDGVCSACLIAEQKASIDWADRDRELRALLDLYRRNDGRYDVLVPGSGGKDSIYAAGMLKTRYGMHPLTCTWAPHLYTEVGQRNFRRFCAIADNCLFTPNEEVHRRLTRTALENLFHPFQPFILGQKSYPPKLAKQLGIKLVFYGESPAEYGNSNDKGPKVDPAYYKAVGALEDIRLGGMATDALGLDLGLTGYDLAPYLPLDDLMGVDVRYLGHYLKWKPQDCYYYAAQEWGFECAPVRTPGTYSKYNSIDDKLDDLHYWTTFIKFGIGRATYDAAQEIRSGDITREEGVKLVERFDGEYPERFEKDVFEYLNVPGFTPLTRERLLMLADKFRSGHLWDSERLRHTVWQ